MQKQAHSRSECKRRAQARTCRRPPSGTCWITCWPGPWTGARMPGCSSCRNPVRTSWSWTRASGCPLECVAPLCRIRPADEPADLVAEAIHRRQPVWVGSGEELAGRLPPSAPPRGRFSAAPTACSPTSTPTCSRAACTRTSTSPATARTSRSPATARRCCDPGAGPVMCSTCRRAPRSASTPRRTTPPRRSPSRPARCWPCSPTDSSKSRARTSTPTSRSSRRCSPTPPAHWTASPTRCSATHSRRVTVPTTPPCCC